MNGKGPMQRPGPVVQTNSLVTQGKGIVTMILTVTTNLIYFRKANVVTKFKPILHYTYSLISTMEAFPFKWL